MPLNGRRFARVNIYIQKIATAGLKATPNEGDRPKKDKGGEEEGVNPSMVSNGRILQTEKRPFRRLSLSPGTNLA